MCPFICFPPLRVSLQVMASVTFLLSMLFLAWGLCVSLQDLALLTSRCRCLTGALVHSLCLSIVVWLALFDKAEPHPEESTVGRHFIWFAVEPMGTVTLSLVV